MLIRKKHICIISIIIISITILLCIIFTKEETNQNNVKSETIELTNFKLEDRAQIIENETVYIGKNVKELSNDFYDLKLARIDNGLEITLNKLWKEKLNAEYIEDEYLIEIVEEVVNILDLDKAIEDIEYELFKYIKQNFLKVKAKEKAPSLELESVKIYAEHRKGECVLYIVKKG